MKINIIWQKNKAGQWAFIVCGQVGRMGNYDGYKEIPTQKGGALPVFEFNLNGGKDANGNWIEKRCKLIGDGAKIAQKMNIMKGDIVQGQGVLTEFTDKSGVLRQTLQFDFLTVMGAGLTFGDEPAQTPPKTAETGFELRKDSSGAENGYSGDDEEEDDLPF